MVECGTAFGAEIVVQSLDQLYCKCVTLILTGESLAEVSWDLP